jgi:thiol:disulfide interchange protein DsbC
MKKLLLCLFANVSLATLMATSVAAAETAAPAKAVDQKSADATIRAAVAKKFPDMKIDEVRPSPMKDIYEVVMGGDVTYISADGRYLIAGDLYEIDSRTNLTENGRQKSRIQALAKLDEKDMIVFKPAKVKHTITVFTDVECGYCRKLHSEIAQLNDRGVQVRYLAYPRAGPGTDDWAKMEAVWCSTDRKKAITEAKAGKAVKAAQCATPIAKQYKLGEQLGVRGTPAIFTDTGEYIGGYLAPDQMVSKLDGTAIN